MGWDIRGIMIQTELVEGIDYKLLPNEYLESGCENEIVNKIYNASDIFLTTTLGEGWGLTFTEAAACKVPIVAPYSTSFMEMSNYGKNAYMLYSFYPYCNQIDNVIREQTDIYEIGETLVQVAKDKSSNALDLKLKVENSYNWVRKLEWKEVCKSWVEYFKNVY
jgi:glycosyltransferase involved in cell wall biosynthesis